MPWNMQMVSYSTISWSSFYSHPGTFLILLAVAPPTEWSKHLPGLLWATVSPSVCTIIFICHTYLTRRAKKLLQGWGIVVFLCSSFGIVCEPLGSSCWWDQRGGLGPHMSRSPRRASFTEALCNLCLQPSSEAEDTSWFRGESQGPEKSRCSPGVRAIVSGHHSTPDLCVCVWLTMLLRNTVHQPVCLEGAKLTLPQLRIPNNRLIWKGCQVHMTMPVVKRRQQRHVAVQKYLKTIFKKNHWPGASFEFWIPLSQTFPTSFVFM